MIIKTSYPFMKPPPSARLIRGHRLAQGLVFFPPFNEDGGLQVFDLSGNNITGTLEGNTNWVPGKFGSALDFPGSTGDYVITDSLPALFDDFSNNAITWSFWMNTPEIPDQGTYTRIMDARKSSTIFVEFAGSNTGEGGGTNIIQFRGRQNNIEGGSSVDVAIPANTWIHVIGIKTAANDWQLYINAVKQSGSLIGTATAITGTVINIGRRADGNASTYYTGLIDLPMIYNRALSASERAELCLRPFGMFERKARTALLSGYEIVIPPVGMAGAMTTNTGYWGW